MIHEPKLVLADEPTGNLDVETAHHVLELLRRTCRDRNATLIVATHSAEIAAQAARVLTIRARPHRGHGIVTRLLRRASLRFYLRHPWQLALAIAGISLGVGVYVGVSLANDSAARAFDVAADRSARRESPIGSCRSTAASTSRSIATSSCATAR